MRAAPYDLVLTRLGPSVPDAEGRGRSVAQGAPTQTRGRLKHLSVREVDQARQLVDHAEAVAHVDVQTTVAGLPVDDACQVKWPDAPASLSGLWDVAAVHHTPALLRLLLRRPQRLRGRS